MPNDCKTLLLWRLHQTGKSSGSVYFFPVVGISPVYLKTTHSHSLQLMSFVVGGWMGNWLHTKVIKAYWSRHLLSILRPTSFILVLRRDAAGLPCQPSHLLLLVFYVPHAIFTFLQESSVVNADSVYHDRKQIKCCARTPLAVVAGYTD